MSTRMSDMTGHVFKGPLLVLLLGSLVIVGSRLLPLDAILRPVQAPPASPLIGEVPEKGAEMDAGGIQEPGLPPDTTVGDITEQPVPEASNAAADAVDEAARLAEQEATHQAEIRRRREAEAAEAERQAEIQRQADLQRQAEQEAQRREAQLAAARRERESAAAARRQREAEAAAAAAREAEAEERRRQAAARPNLRVFVEADVNDRAGLGAFTPATYSNRLKVELGLSAQEILGAAAVSTGDDNLAFRDLVRQGRDGLDRVCRQAGSARVLLADVTIEAAGFSSIDSAYWPQLQIIAVNCENGRTQRTRKQRLEPHRLDRFGFQQHFSERAREFISSQEYFLAP